MTVIASVMISPRHWELVSGKFFHLITTAFASVTSKPARRWAHPATPKLHVCVLADA